MHAGIPILLIYIRAMLYIDYHELISFLKTNIINIRRQILEKTFFFSCKSLLIA